jgi:hypothetical protein
MRTKYDDKTGEKNDYGNKKDRTPTTKTDDHNGNKNDATMENIILMRDGKSHVPTTTPTKIAR